MATPQAQAQDEDDGYVPTLLQRHAAAIAAVRAAVEDALKGNTDADADVAATRAEYLDVDDQVVLRFVLSAAKRKPSSPAEAAKLAAANMVTAITQDAAMRADILATRAAGKPEWMDIIPAAVVGTLGDDILLVARFGYDMNAVMRHPKVNNSPDFITKSLILVDEYIYRQCILRTRETNRMAKLTLVFDMSVFALSHINMTFLKAVGKASHHNEVARPQLMRRIVTINPPLAFRTLYAMFAPFMSKATLEKNSMCRAKGKLEGRSAQSECPFLRRFAEKGEDVDSVVPREFGGKNPVQLKREI